MNCDEYKQAIGADPSFDGGAAHLTECASCQAYRRDMLALEEKIKGALAISVPEIKLPELEAIETDNVVALPQRRLSTPAWFAVAASVVVAVMVGLTLLPTTGNDGPEALAAEILAHIDHEPQAFLPTNTKISDERLNHVVPTSIARLDHSAGLITYAETCPVSGNDVPHLVIQGERGPITIMLLPDEKISEAIPLNNESSHGVILPVGDGSIAIVGARDEKLEEVQKQLLQSVMWET